MTPRSVLTAGAGPAGLTAAVELARRGIAAVGLRAVMPVATRIRPIHRRALVNVSGLASPDPPWLD